MFIPVFSLYNTCLFILVAFLSVSCSTIKEILYQQLKKVCYLEIDAIEEQNTVKHPIFYEIELKNKKQEVLL